MCDGTNVLHDAGGRGNLYARKIAQNRLSTALINATLNVTHQRGRSCGPTLFCGPAYKVPGEPWPWYRVSSVQRSRRWRGARAAHNLFKIIPVLNPCQRHEIQVRTRLAWRNNLGETCKVEYPFSCTCERKAGFAGGLEFTGDEHRFALRESGLPRRPA